MEGIELYICCALLRKSNMKNSPLLWLSRDGDAIPVHAKYMPAKGRGRTI